MAIAELASKHDAPEQAYTLTQDLLQRLGPSLGLADAARAEGKAAPTGSNWLSSHPSNDKRLEDIKRIAAGYSGNYGDDGRARVKAVEAARPRTRYLLTPAARAMVTARTLGGDRVWDRIVSRQLGH